MVASRSAPDFVGAAGRVSEFPLGSAASCESGAVFAASQLSLCAMGIKQLMNFLKENAPKSVREVSFDQMTNRTLAIDASMNLSDLLAGRLICES